MTSAEIHDPAEPVVGPKAWRFLKRLTAVTAGGMFIDGYIFAVIGVTMALQTFKDDLHVTTTWAGLISSATLIGIFIGATTFGWLTDRVGRKAMFLGDLAGFAIASVLMFFVQSSWQMFALGLIMGLAVGADYAIGSPLITEFSPTSLRARLTSFLQIAWNVGYVVAFLIGYLITRAYPHEWRLVLVSAFIPAALCLIARHGLPESPRWLLSQGRREEAEAVLAQLDWSLESGDFQAEQPEEAKFSTIFSRDYIGRTFFVSMFWTCLVLPYFAIIFFQADVLKALHMTNPIVSALVGTIVALAGAVLGWYLIERVGRRRLLIVPLWITGIALLIVSFDASLPRLIVAVAFFVYLFAYGVASILCGVYPMELFPTAVRTSGVGFSSSVSRIGAAIGTFLLPIALNHWSVGGTMAVMGAVCIAGAIGSQYLAPETTGRSLAEVSSKAARGVIRTTAERRTAASPATEPKVA
ncbi:sugar porter family MFS transporter [Nocardia sp. NEAU-G5]|uniref:Sugar porter family MFS transporter n=1 Tax=Nocardia albiluteola TaxID=2842303 RepID=A0ABS6AZP1_9NOCA|nr:MFS transporter [Nocardia albiluteola]MBU3062666.1 sugar porter family MFS transporter [Nocardia albiluteola]MBU3065500.1 sugar porter family MFS transporter [Nocardia albiluteola]